MGAGEVTAPGRIPELLAPAGDIASLEAAVGAGADAVYFGASRFSARARAANFDRQAMAGALDNLHLHGRRGYLALNTLLADEELPEAVDLAETAFLAGVDAVILQDMGLARILSRELPDLPLHASTQMTIQDRDGMAVLAHMGFQRIILPREMTLPDIADKVREAESLGLGIEVFVHGALCVGVSGQCLFSSFLGGRSGNRGECAQPCRLPYRLERNGVPSGDAVPRLSLRDLSGLPLLPALCAAGVRSLKIEGRLRSPAYVRQVVSVYRDALDQLGTPPGDDRRCRRDADLLLAFSRGGRNAVGWLAGRPDDTLWTGPESGRSGLVVGRVEEVRPMAGWLRVRLDPLPSGAGPLAEAAYMPGPGDLLAVVPDERARSGDPDGPESSGRIVAPIGTAERSGDLLAVRGFHPDLLARMRPGDRVERMSDAKAEREADRSKPGPAIPAEIRLESGEDGQLRLSLSVVGTGAGAGCRVTVAESDGQPAPLLPPERVEAQLRRSGGTPFRIDGVDITTPVLRPVSSLNALRRAGLDHLEACVRSSFRRSLPADRRQTPASDPGPVTRPQAWTGSDGGDPAVDAILVAYSQFGEDSRTLACGADGYLFPLASLRLPEFDGAIDRLRSLEPHARLGAVWPPLATGQAYRELADLLPGLARRGMTWLYSGSPAIAEQAGRYGLVPAADTTANLFNRNALASRIESGVRILCPSLELDMDRLSDMAEWIRETHSGEVRLEWTAYGRIPLLWSAWCPVGLRQAGCRLCRSGTGDDPVGTCGAPGRTCGGRGGKRSDLALADRLGGRFPVLPDPSDCGSVLYNRDLLLASEEMAVLRSRGPLRIRLRVLDETPDERHLLVSAFRALLARSSGSGSPGTGSAREAAERLRAVARQVADRTGSGLTRGHYRRGVAP